MNEREALRLALEALEKTQNEGYNLPGSAIREAITAIKQALEQPEQLREENERLHVENRRLIDRIETIGVPVGVGGFATTTAQPEPEPVGQIIDQYNNANTGSSPPTPMPIWFNQLPPIGSKLYISPPKREPLTDEEIDAKWRKATELPALTSEFVRSFARAIEAAHGIKEKNHAE